MGKKQRPQPAARKNPAAPAGGDADARRVNVQATRRPADSAAPTNPDPVIPAAFRRAVPARPGPVPQVGGRPAPARTPPVGRSIAGQAATPGVVLEEEQVEPRGWVRWLQSAAGDAGPHGLAVTYAFDTRTWTAPSAVEIQFVGTRLDGSGQPGDSFEHIERVEELDPRTGPAALTVRVQDITPGRWRIVARPAPSPSATRLPPRAVTTSTTLAALAQGPAVHLLAWPVLVGLGAVLAITVQAMLLARSGVSVAPVVAMSVLACLLGFLGAKVWYLVAKRLHPRELLHAGAYIQGFLLAALVVLLVGAVLTHLPPLAVLDATAPGIFLGMAVGRPGCFLTGCCTGRPTLSRWGLWSSDRRLATRRVPVQLLEAGIALTIGLGSLALVLAGPPPVQGSILAGAVAAYTLSRQFLFPLRAQSHTRAGRLANQVLCGTILTAVALSFLPR